MKKRIFNPAKLAKRTDVVEKKAAIAALKTAQKSQPRSLKTLEERIELLESLILNRKE